MRSPRTSTDPPRARPCRRTRGRGEQRLSAARRARAERAARKQQERAKRMAGRERGSHHVYPSARAREPPVRAWRHIARHAAIYIFRDRRRHSHRATPKGVHAPLPEDRPRRARRRTRRVARRRRSSRRRRGRRARVARPRRCRPASSSACSARTARARRRRSASCTTRVRPTSGAALVAGRGRRAREPSRVRQRIGVVPQRPNPDRSLNVLENLVFHAAYFGIAARGRDARAHGSCSSSSASPTSASAKVDAALRAASSSA